MSGRRARVAFVASLAAAIAAADCASPGLPPGGPPDPNPPKLVRVTPDTGRVNVRPPRVVFQFDEVVSERPQGAVSLERLFLVSPRDGEPDVDWHRDAITVKPHRGFRANTVYTVTMLPGLVDLRGNVSKAGAQTVFSTGPTIPRSRITGTVFDWVAGNVAAAPLVQVVQRPDSVVFVTVADSSGRFVFPYLAPGRYTVIALQDANTNRALDPRESWDSVTVLLDDSASVELLAFVHDSTGPGIRDITVADSVTLRVALDRPMDPTVPLVPALFTLRAPDSTAIGVASVQSAAAFDSTRANAPAGPPAAGAPAGAPRQGARPAPRPPALPPPEPPTAEASARDTIPVDSMRVRAATRARPGRPIPPTEVVLRTARPLAPGTSYRLETPGLRGLLGTQRPSNRLFTTPKAAPPDSVRRDSTRADSTRAPRPTAPRNPR